MKKTKKQNAEERFTWRQEDLEISRSSQRPRCWEYFFMCQPNPVLRSQVLTALMANQVDQVNPFAGKLTLHVEPRLTGNAWRLFADPAELPVIAIAYLNGQAGPIMEVEQGWDFLGAEFRCILDFGAGITEYRGTYLNPGN